MTVLPSNVGKMAVGVSLLAAADGLIRTYQLMREDLLAIYQAI